MARTAWLSVTLALLALSGCEPGPNEHEHEGEHEGEEGVVAIDSQQLAAAGIVLAAAGAGPIEERLSLTAVVRPDLDAQAHITPKVPGLVRAIRKQLGERVEPGEVVCELESTELGLVVSRYREERALLAAAQEILASESELLERKVDVARTIYEREAALKQQELTTLRPFYEAERALAEARLERQSRLLALQAALRQREIALHTAEEQLHILGLEQDEIEQLAGEQTHSHGHYRLRAPRAGVIVARDVTENEFVGTDDKLFLIQDLSRVWVVASAYEKDLRQLARGQPARVRLDAFPGLELTGEVTFIQYEVGRVSRSVEVRVELPNAALPAGGPGWQEPFPLRPGMFGRVDVVLASRVARVVIPEAAVVHEGELDFVFVRDEHEPAHEGTELRFERRVVQLGAHSGERVEVLAGLEPGQQVVVEGVFSLKSLARQGELGGGHSH